MYLNVRAVAVIFILLAETLESPEAARIVKPYKYYRPKPRNRGHRFHSSFPGPSRFHRSKKTLARDAFYRGSNHPRYGSLDEQPYTIVIQLPKRQEELESYSRKEHRDFRRNRPRDEEYFDDYEEDDELEEKSLYLGEKKLRIKLVKGPKPKLHINISRSDDLNYVEFVGEGNSTTSTTNSSTPTTSVNRNFPWENPPG